MPKPAINLALCTHCSKRIVHDESVGWTEPACDGTAGPSCPYNARGHEPDNEHLTHLKNPADA